MSLGFFSSFRTVLFDIISLWLSPRRLLDAWKRTSTKGSASPKKPSSHDYKYRTWPIRGAEGGRWKRKQKLSVSDLSQIWRQETEVLPDFYCAASLTPQEQETARAIRRVFSLGDASIEKFRALVRELNKIPIFLIDLAFNRLAQGSKTISEEQLVSFWHSHLRCTNVRALFNILKRDDAHNITGEDLCEAVKILVSMHPGLAFLTGTPEFQKRYVQTVTERIFYSVNVSKSSKVSYQEFSKSNLPKVLLEVEKRPDINEVSDFFSYVEFYVVYCKFKELDLDNDQMLGPNDLIQYANHSLTRAIVNRLFEVLTTRQRNEHPKGKMDYQDFIWFILSEEDKATRTSQEYWFRLIDLDGDGYISVYELEFFYQEQIRRMESLKIEVVPFDQVLRQIMDMVNPRKGDLISLADVRRSKMGGLMYNMLFNLSKFIAAEQSNPYDSHSDSLSDWQRFAQEEYQLALLEQEEQLDEEDEEDDEDGQEADEDIDEDEEVFDEADVFQSSAT